MNLMDGGADEADLDQAAAYFEPVSFNYNSRYKSKSKKNGRLNYTSNQYRSAQNRMSRGHYQDDIAESAVLHMMDGQVNEMTSGNEFVEHRNESNQFELQDYKRTLNMVNKRGGYASDQLTSDGTPFISGDCKHPTADLFVLNI